MEIITFTTEENGRWRAPRVGALLNNQYLLDFAAAVDGTDGPANHLRWLDMDGPWFQKSRATYESLMNNLGLLPQANEKGWLTKRADAYWLAPVPRPGKVICIGLNYRDHAAESNMPIPERPVVFSKFATAVIAPGEPVVLPPASTQVDYEAELAVVIGRQAKNVSATRALDYVLGYTAFNDVSARDFQFADGQWQRGKSCDTFAPMGPKIVTTDVVPDPHKLSIKLILNGQTMQDSNTNQLIFGVPELIEFLSQTITLEPGDVIATGTPAGVGFARKPPVFLRPGDVMEVDIDRVGKLNSQIVAG
ncbi:MAG TPA: fumarylacetoacetate hydrolase family protein [Pyrinomonadaceae bacterium]|jgi:2-keto-4-pentenoate hydratase/2-oxohepta-3-ene-1,7-dioic acid hydratase in catechol pathway